MPKRKESTPSRSEIERRLQQRVRALRLGGGLTVPQLAEAAGISVDALTKLEAGDRAPRLGTIASLASALGVTIAELIDEAKPRYSASVTRIVQLLDGQTPDVQDLARQAVQILLQAAAKKSRATRLSSDPFAGGRYPPRTL